MSNSTFYLIPAEKLAAIESWQQQILELIKNHNNPKPLNGKSYLTAKEFIVAVSIGRSKFDQLIAANQIKSIKKERKIYIPATEVERYFGEADNK